MTEQIQSEETKGLATALAALEVAHQSLHPLKEDTRTQVIHRRVGVLLSEVAYAYFDQLESDHKRAGTTLWAEELQLREDAA